MATTPQDLSFLAVPEVYGDNPQAMTIDQIIGAIQSQYAPVTPSSMDGQSYGAGRFITGDYATGGGTQFGAEVAPAWFTPGEFDINAFSQKMPEDVQEKISSGNLYGGDLYSPVVDVNIPDTPLGQGLNNNAINATLNLMALGEVLGKVPGKLGLFGKAVSFGSDISSDARINSLNESFNALSNAQNQPGVNTFSDQHGNVISYSTPETIASYDAATFGVDTDNAVTSPVSDYGNVTGVDIGSLSQGTDAGAGGFDIGVSDIGSNGDGGGGGGGTKIICTAMNQHYGFGSFRNAIWIAYADKHLTKAHEVGYHAIFLPLVDYGFKRGDGKLNLIVRKIMEWGTRHRSTDLRAEMRNGKRDLQGRIIRSIFEPLCYIVGKIKGY